MWKRILALAVLGTLSLSESVHSQPDSALAYYPLSVGNAWQYKRTTDYLGDRTGWYSWVRATNDTIMPNGRKYVRLEGALSDDGGYYPLWIFQRVDSTTANVYEWHEFFPAGYRECLAESLCASQYDYFPGAHCTSYPGHCLSFDTTTILSQSTLSKEFAVNIIPSPRYILAKGFGLIQKQTFREGEVGYYTYTAELVHARINGREFGQPVSVEDHLSQAPRAYHLEQNFPNPWNPSTTIRYSLLQRSGVSLAVYNTLGQQVATLVKEEQEAGFHEVKFDASGLSSGVYFYQIQAGSFFDTKKLLLLR